MIVQHCIISFYVNHHAQILNPDLALLGSEGSEGSGNGHVKSPQDVAFDTIVWLIVHMQVFTTKDQDSF